MLKMISGCLLVCCLALANEAAAQFPCGMYGGGFGAWYGLPTMWQDSYNGRTPPYFAVHPPVYYSGEIVRIPYGASPWAAAPTRAAASMVTATPAVRSNTAAAIMLDNPHYQRGAAKKTAVPVDAVRPHGKITFSAPESTKVGEMILNQHYRTQAKHSSDKVATRE
jgi:hypothetical protein